MDNHREIHNSWGFPSMHLQSTASGPMPHHSDDIKRLRHVSCVCCVVSPWLLRTFLPKRPSHSVLTTELHNSFIVIFLRQLSNQGGNDIMGFFPASFHKEFEVLMTKH